jgi:tRNA-splicing ligase RtcB (3'-phosphate/5'-hydroxy nucleic acid ligase)
MTQQNTTAAQVIYDTGSKPIKIWTKDIEPEALNQLKNLARLPFIAKQGVACMPDVHAGIGSTVGTVIATDKAIIPAAVGVDIGCGMVACRLSLKASDLPDSLSSLRSAIEARVPLGAGGEHVRVEDGENIKKLVYSMPVAVHNVFGGSDTKANAKMAKQLGTLGSGNHFIELCIDESQDVWVMLHSGSRGIGNMIGSYYITKGKELMEQFHITLPDGDLAYLPQGTDVFEDYVAAVQWAQDYAMENRKAMLAAVLAAMRLEISKDFTITEEAINCHHNYVEKENHFGQNLWITRKGAIRAREGDLGIIPGSMGQRSYIIRGKGNKESYCSCSHGAGRKMSRTAARKQFTVADLVEQTKGVECRKDDAVLDEIPGSYKNIDEVMENQKSLVDVVHVLKQVMCIKGA